ncbi:MAG: lipoate--protein ligase family protein [Bacteroidota bacterium]|nr:lipoate--protein ligase family protein [Bacteroidota bacterium]
MIEHSTRWQFLDTGFRTGSENMQFDEELALRLQRNEILPTLRVYGWKPWAISLGHHQKENDVDSEKCRRDGINIVRRATGGRAILHANEVTYSVVMFADGRGVNDVYCDISKALVAGLRRICPEVEYEISQPHFPSLYKKAESVPCFASSARYEVQIKGKKLVGSAQRRFTSQDFSEVILQHGSILLGDEHKKLVDYLTIDDDDVRRKMKNDFDIKTISLCEATKRSVQFDEAASAVKSGFEEAIGVSFHQPSEEFV